jgi:hypothetical protein
MIPFHDNESIETLGIAAFLHVVSAGDDFVAGALLLLNARGEPLEFVFNRLELMRGELWRERDKPHAAARRLCATLFQAAQLAPSLLFYRAPEIAPGLFGPHGQLLLEIPVARVSSLHQQLSSSADEVAARITTFDGAGEVGELDVLWTPQPPHENSAELFAKLVERGLILEPFDRATRALQAALQDKA